MLSGRSRLIIATAILIPAIVYLGMDDGPGNKRQAAAPSPAHQQSDYYIVQGRIRDFGLDGQLKRQLKATQLEHQPALRQTFIEEPELRLYDEKQPEKKITSLSGIIRDENNQVTLTGQVKLQDHPNTGQASLLETESLIYLPEETLITTDRKVRLSNPAGVTTATGMRIDTGNSIIELLSDVKGIHHAN